MQSKQNDQKIRWPENRKYAKMLHYGDSIRLSKATGIKKSNISVILQGRRNMPDKLLSAIIDIIETRKALVAKAKSLVNDQNL